MTSPISITTLAALASAGVLRTVQLVGQVGGYAVMVRVGQTETQLTGQRGEARVFASLDTGFSRHTCKNSSQDWISSIASVS
ncbi:hypothetical protein [Xanthomonas citri]|uniref:hypothetical protein n=1 Tax=Xanthomonas citri TaxID=346 RepID=UPI001CBF0992|nr:hypothetical protein [Xanthomonas citri]